RKPQPARGGPRETRSAEALTGLTGRERGAGVLRTDLERDRDVESRSLPAAVARRPREPIQEGVEPGRHAPAPEPPRIRVQIAVRVVGQPADVEVGPAQVAPLVRLAL